MKKNFLFLGLGLALSFNVFASDNTVERLNDQLINMLEPFQNQSTVANVTFTSIETDEEHALKVALNGLYRKTGPANLLEIKINNLSYDYNNGIDPTISLSGSLGTNLLKIIPQDNLNFYLSNATQLIDIYAQDFIRQYGDAASFKGVVTSTKQDKAGNYTNLSGLITAKIDLQKLPEDQNAKNVAATEVSISIDLDVTKGVTVDAFIVSNPTYTWGGGFAGFKEFLDKLLAQDQDVMNALEKGFTDFDQWAAGFVGANGFELLKHTFNSAL